MKTISQIELNMLIERHNKYLKSLMDSKKRGERLLLDEIDFTCNNLSDLNFVDIYITSSYFSSQIFENKNMGDAKLYSCIFENIIFENCNLGKTVLDYARIVNCKFINCNLVELETLETSFEGVLFRNCTFNGAFSDCVIKNATFEGCIITSTEFWKCSIESLKVSNKTNQWELKKFIREINIGTITTPQYIKDSEAIEYFEKQCDIV